MKIGRILQQAELATVPVFVISRIQMQLQVRTVRSLTEEVEVWSRQFRAPVF
jgi:hypothetical protein